MLCTRVPTPPGTTATVGSSLTHTPMSTSFSRDLPTHNGMCYDSIHWSVVLHSEHLVSTSPSPSPSCQLSALTWDTQLVSLVQCMKQCRSDKDMFTCIQNDIHCSYIKSTSLMSICSTYAVVDAHADGAWLYKANCLC